MGSAWGSVDNIAAGKRKAIELRSFEAAVMGHAKQFLQIERVHT